MNSFSVFPLSEHIVSAVNKMFKSPTDVQKRVIPLAMSGKNIIGQSQTGTGKTHAFLLPIFSKINVSNKETQALVIAPTRELANQIYKAAQALNNLLPKNSQINIQAVIGGTDKKRKVVQSKNMPQLLIGTPFRMCDLISSNTINVFCATMLVVDEADLLIDLGFMAEVDKIAVRMSKNLQIMVFSATIPIKLQPFLKKYMENPKHIVVDQKNISPAKIEHILVPYKHRSRGQLISNILRLCNPYLALIFTNSKKNADSLQKELVKQGLRVGLMHGDLPVRERKRVINDIRALKYQYVVASDLAARGIDICGVTHVINAEIPQDLDFYIHRSGRSGRAGLSGTAITLFEDSDNDSIVRLEKMGISFINKDFVNGELVDIKNRSRRKKLENIAKKTTTKVITKSTVVKPGYKKKHALEVKKVLEQEKRVQKRKDTKQARLKKKLSKN